MITMAPLHAPQPTLCWLVVAVSASGKEVAARNQLAVGAGAASGRLGEECTHSGNQLVRNYHRGVRRILERRFDFGRQLIVGPRLVVLDEIVDARLVPARRQPVRSVAHLLLLRLRRRNATRALPDSS